MLDFRVIGKAALRYSPTVATILIAPLVLTVPQSIGIQLAAVIVAISAEVSDFYLPANNVRKFRKRYLDDLTAEWLKDWLRDVDVSQKERLTSGFRFCLFDIRRPWYLGFCRRVFERPWRRNFLQNHKDVRLFMFANQGVAGVAVEQRTFVFDRLRPYSVLTTQDRRATLARWRMWGWQLRQTEHIVAILSVPVFAPLPDGDEIGKKPILSVLNVDAITDEAADLMAANWKRMGEDIAKHAEYVSLLRV